MPTSARGGECSCSSRSASITDFATIENVNTIARARARARARELTSGLITLADIHLTHFGSTTSSCSTMRVRTLCAILSAPRCIIALEYHTTCETSHRDAVAIYHRLLMLVLEAVICLPRHQLDLISKNLRRHFLQSARIRRQTLWTTCTSTCSSCFFTASLTTTFNKTPSTSTRRHDLVRILLEIGTSTSTHTLPLNLHQPPGVSAMRSCSRLGCSPYG